MAYSIDVLNQAYEAIGYTGDQMAAIFPHLNSEILERIIIGLNTRNIEDPLVREAAIYILGVYINWGQLNQDLFGPER